MEVFVASLTFNFLLIQKKYIPKNYKSKNHAKHRFYPEPTLIIETLQNCYFSDGLGEDDANEAVKTFLVSWRKEEAQRRLKNMKNKKKNKKRTKTEKAIAQDKRHSDPK